ncbi:MAG: hypothetical protein KCHDKBKB_01161 [Elusimicrobia bacterium]|nr:hypothetical protein [Elusimicrobiota bacterium]
MLVMVFLLNALSLQAAMKSQMVTYKQGSAVLEGYLVYDDAQTGPRPGVLVAHEWMGLNDYAKKRADQLAGLGYVAFALDVYGKGKSVTNPADAAKLSGQYKADRPLLRGRMQAGLNVLAKNPQVDPKRIGAIGYCFGGTSVLELARSGAEVQGVVSFHGGLSSPTPMDAKNIKAKVLVFNGADDPHVSSDEIRAFEKEMQGGQVDWQFVNMGGAVHGFTNPAGGNDNSKGYAYNEKADKRSWEGMKLFFAEVFQ